MMQDMAVTTIVPDWPVAHRLRRAAEVAGLSRPQLARELRKSETTIDNYMKGRTTPDYSTFRHISELTGVPEWWLEGHDTDPSGDVPPLQDRRSRNRREQVSTRSGCFQTYLPAAA